MKKLFFALLVIAVSCAFAGTSFAETKREIAKKLNGNIYRAKSRGEADFIVYVTKYAGQADLLVFRGGRVRETSCGMWHFVKTRAEADFAVYFAKYFGEGDLNVYFVRTPAEAGFGAAL